MVKVSVGDEVKIPAAPTREGYTFLYWKDADSKYYPGDKYTVEGDHTFTAVWKKKSDESNKDDGKSKGDDKKSTASTGNNSSNKSTGSDSGNSASTQSSSPSTGDNSPLEQNLVIAAVALSLLLVLFGIEVRRRRGR